jgi:hypothetical protein
MLHHFLLMSILQFYKMREKNTVQLYLLSTTNDSAERTSVGNKSKTG